MATIASPPAPVKPIPPDAAAVAFGARVRHVSLPGLWKVVAVTPFSDTFRVRQLAGDGSLIGPVMIWTTKELAPAVGLEPGPVRVEVGPPAAVYTVAPLPAAARPLVVTLTLTIDGTAYDVTPQAAGPLAVRGFRLEKLGRDGSPAYDLDDLGSYATCSCPDAVYRRDGGDCKHLKAARMMGLLESAPILSDARAAYDDAREAETAAACCAAAEPAPCLTCTDLPAATLPEVEPFHPGDTLDPRTLDADLDGDDDDAPSSWDDATSWTTTEDDALPGDRWGIIPEVGPIAVEVKAKRARTPKATAAKLVPLAELPLAEGLAGRIAALRAEHTPLATLMADHLGGLLSQVEAVGATTVATFRDRLEAMRGDLVPCFEG